MSMIILICYSFLKNIQTAYYYFSGKKDDAELKVDDMSCNFDDDDDKLLNSPEMTK